MQDNRGCDAAAVCCPAPSVRADVTQQRCAALRHVVRSPIDGLPGEFRREDELGQSVPIVEKSTDSQVVTYTIDSPKPSRG